MGDAAEEQAALEPLREIEDRLAAPHEVERGRETAHVREVPLDAGHRVVVGDALPDGRDDLLRGVRVHDVQLRRVTLLNDHAGIARQGKGEGERVVHPVGRVGKPDAPDRLDDLAAIGGEGQLQAGALSAERVATAARSSGRGRCRRNAPRLPGAGGLVRRREA